MSFTTIGCFYILDAKAVLEKGTIIMGQQQWVVRPSSTQTDRTDSGHEADPCTLEVRGIKPGTSPEHISLFFESYKSKGGEIAGLSLFFESRESKGGDIDGLSPQSNGVALVKFADPEGWYLWVFA